MIIELDNYFEDDDKIVLNADKVCAVFKDHRSPTKGATVVILDGYEKMLLVKQTPSEVARIMKGEDE